MEHGRSCLMDECEAMASGRERSPTIITPTPALSSCHRKQASLGVNDKSATRLLSLFTGSIPLWPMRVPGEACYDFRSGSKADSERTSAFGAKLTFAVPSDFALRFDVGVCCCLDLCLGRNERLSRRG
jgi:hypothetical protein